MNTVREWRDTTQPTPQKSLSTPRSPFTCIGKDVPLSAASWELQITTHKNLHLSLSLSLRSGKERNFSLFLLMNGYVIAWRRQLHEAAVSPGSARFRLIASPHLPLLRLLTAGSSESLFRFLCAFSPLYVYCWAFHTWSWLRAEVALVEFRAWLFDVSESGDSEMSTFPTRGRVYGERGRAL